MTNFEKVDIDAIVDQVAKDPKQAKAAKAALKKIAGFSEKTGDFKYKRRMDASDADDDMFDNMPV